MRARVVFLAIAACLALALPAWAVTLEDVIKLAQGGVGDDVIMSQIQAEGTVFQLSAQDILTLKNAHVSDKVINFMIQTRPPAPRPGGPGPGDEGGNPPGAMAGVTLVLVNSDDRNYSIQVDEAGHMLFYYYGNFQDRLSLGRGETRSITVSPGEWVVRWVGEREAYRFRAAPGQTAKLTVNGVDFADYRSTNLTITVGDREVASGPLKKYVDRGAPQAPAPPRPPVAAGPPPEEPGNVNLPPQNPWGAASYAQPSPVVINYYPNPGTVTYREYYTAPPVYYADPGYYSDPYYYPRRSNAFITPSTLFFTGLGAALDKHNRAEGALAGFAFSKFVDGAAYGDPLFGW